MANLGHLYNKSYSALTLEQDAYPVRTINLRHVPACLNFGASFDALNRAEPQYGTQDLFPKGVEGESQRERTQRLYLAARVSISRDATAMARLNIHRAIEAAEYEYAVAIQADLAISLARLDIQEHNFSESRFAPKDLKNPPRSRQWRGRCDGRPSGFSARRRHPRSETVPSNPGSFPNVTSCCRFTRPLHGICR